MSAHYALYASAATNCHISVRKNSSPAAVAVCYTYSYALAEGIVPGGDVVPGADGRLPDGDDKKPGDDGRSRTVSPGCRLVPSRHVPRRSTLGWSKHSHNYTY